MGSQQMITIPLIFFNLLYLNIFAIDFTSEIEYFSMSVKSNVFYTFNAETPIR